MKKHYVFGLTAASVVLGTLAYPMVIKPREKSRNFSIEHHKKREIACQMITKAYDLWHIDHDLKGAEGLIRQAMALDGSDNNEVMRAWDLAEILAAQGRYAEAVVYYRKVFFSPNFVSSDQQSPSAWSHYGRSAERAGYKDEAKRAYAYALHLSDTEHRGADIPIDHNRIAKGNPAEAAALVSALDKLDYGQNQEALDALLPIANDSAQPEVFYVLGAVYHALGNDTEAESAYRRVLAGRAQQPLKSAAQAAIDRLKRKP